MDSEFGRAISGYFAGCIVSLVIGLLTARVTGQTHVFFEFITEAGAWLKGKIMSNGSESKTSNIIMVILTAIIAWSAYDNATETRKHNRLSISETRKHNRLSIRPLFVLEKNTIIDEDRNPSVTLSNEGEGPAINVRIELCIDGRNLGPMTLETLKGGIRSIDNDQLKGLKGKDVIRFKYWFLSTPEEGTNIRSGGIKVPVEIEILDPTKKAYQDLSDVKKKEMYEDIISKIDFIVSYESLYNEAFTDTLFGPCS